MDSAMSTPATSTSASSPFYCELCSKSFAGKKEFKHHMKHAKAHFPSGITCYFPGCSKTYQKLESLYTHVGRDHREEIEALLLEKHRCSKEVWAPQQHVAYGSNDTSFLTMTQSIVGDPHDGLHQMADTTPMNLDAPISTAHKTGLSTDSTAFAGPQHMFKGFPPYIMNASYSSNREMDRSPQWPYTTTQSAVGMSTASSLPPSTSQLGTSSTPAGSLDHTYPALGMLPASASSYAGLTGQFGDNYQGQGTLAMGAAYSDLYMGNPNTMLDDDTEISRDTYIR